MSGLDGETIKHALEAAKDLGFRHVRLKNGDEKFSAVIQAEAPAPVAIPSHAVAESDSVELAPDFKEVKSPCVGFFQEGKVELKEGAKISSGDVIGFVVALGIKNEVVSNVSGEVTETLVVTNQPVQYGQAIVKVKP